MDFPQMIRIRQKFKTPKLDDIPQKIKSRIKHLGLEKKVTRGQTVAVACSSRGINNYSTIVETVVSSLKQIGLTPFIVPSMGSHGAATALGQQRVLEHLGITEKEMGVPIRSSLDVVRIGETAENIPVYLDKLAARADHIVLVNRIKKHTEFEHEFESGLLKLMAIGLGKQKGAATYHEAMLTYGYPKVIYNVAREVMRYSNVLFGVGVVENGYNQTADIDICPPENIKNMEIDLLRTAKKLAPRLPFDQADILIVDEMGKDISGTGFDTKVVGRIGLPLIAKEPESPKIKRILICDLTTNSEGNAVGVGIADMITQRLLDKIDMDALNINTITGVCPEMGKIPLTLKNDREAIRTAIKCVGLVPFEQLKIMRIKNTSLISDVDISQGYENELLQRNDLIRVEEKKPMAFDPSGNLDPF